MRNLKPLRSLLLFSASQVFMECMSCHLRQTPGAGVFPSYESWHREYIVHVTVIWSWHMIRRWSHLLYSFRVCSLRILYLPQYFNSCTAIFEAILQYLLCLFLKYIAVPTLPILEIYCSTYFASFGNVLQYLHCQFWNILQYLLCQFRKYIVGPSLPVLKIYFSTALLILQIYCNTYALCLFCLYIAVLFCTFSAYIVIILQYLLFLWKYIAVYRCLYISA